jgi:hypothetical protein
MMELKERTGAEGFASVVVVVDACGSSGRRTSTLSCSPARKEKGFFLGSVVVMGSTVVARVPMEPKERDWFAGEFEMAAALFVEAAAGFDFS